MTDHNAPPHPNNINEYTYDHGTSVVAFMTAFVLTEVFGKAWYNVAAGEDVLLAIKAHPEHESLLREMESEPPSIEAYVAGFGGEFIPGAVQLVRQIIENARSHRYGVECMDDWYDELLAYFKAHALPRKPNGAPDRESA